MLHIDVKIILSAFQRCTARFTTLNIIVVALENVTPDFFCTPSSKYQHGLHTGLLFETGRLFG